MGNFGQPIPETEKTVQQLAAEGHFRAIAQWLNEPLVAHEVYAQVCPDDRPGCLRIQVEFKQAPPRERLTRFLCSRIWKLNSSLIEGIHIVARTIGERRPLWQQRIKVVAPVHKRTNTSAFNQSSSGAESTQPRTLNVPLGQSKKSPATAVTLKLQRSDGKRDISDAVPSHPLAQSDGSSRPSPS